VTHELISDHERSAHDELLGRERAVLALVVIVLAITLVWTALGVSNGSWLLFLFTPVLSARLTGWIEWRRFRGPNPKFAP
jgi:hypothetical protein